MSPLNLDDVRSFIESNIGNFHTARWNSLERLKLRAILLKKNPYLFRAKNILTGHELVKTLLDAHLSSQEEAIFGEFLEQLAIFVSNRVEGGHKSAAEGIDLEIHRDGQIYLIVLKSGPNWGNSGQIRDLRETFKKAKRILRTNNPSANVVAINGCSYGRVNQVDRGDYLKLCGQRFWEFISGNAELYKEIIEPLGYRAKEKNEEFQQLYAQSINRFELEILQEFCDDGIINWNKLVEFNSASMAPKVVRRKKKLDAN